MALREQDIPRLKPSPATREEARAKASFDSAIVIIRDESKWANSPEAMKYFYRELMREVRSLESRLKVLAVKPD